MTDLTFTTRIATTLPPQQRQQVLHQRLEGLGLVAIGLGLHVASGAGWGLFAGLILAPDLAFVGYLAGNRVGAMAYNLAHSLFTAGLVLALGWLAGAPLALAFGAVMVAHIGADRALGYGFKSTESPRRSHLDLG